MTGSSQLPLEADLADCWGDRGGGSANSAGLCCVNFALLQRTRGPALVWDPGAVVQPGETQKVLAMTLRQKTCFGMICFMGQSVARPAPVTVRK